MMMNILITTAILWAVSACFVLPLCNAWLSNRLREPAYAHLNKENLNEAEQAELQSLATTTYILSDVAVLGLSGLIGGLLGYWFIGVSLEARGWPRHAGLYWGEFVRSKIVRGVSSSNTEFSGPLRNLRIPEEARVRRSKH